MWARFNTPLKWASFSIKVKINLLTLSVYTRRTKNPAVGFGASTACPEDGGHQQPTPASYPKALLVESLIWCGE